MRDFDFPLTDMLFLLVYFSEYKISTYIHIYQIIIHLNIYL